MSSYKTILGVYGDWLFERREFKDAALGTMLALLLLMLLLNLACSIPTIKQSSQSYACLREGTGLARSLRDSDSGEYVSRGSGRHRIQDCRYVRHAIFSGAQFDS